MRGLRLEAVPHRGTLQRLEMVARDGTTIDLLPHGGIKSVSFRIDARRMQGEVVLAW